MNEFKNFLISWNTMCIKPVGNSITLSPLDKHWIDEIKNNLSKFITETDSSYIIHYCGNTINIEKMTEKEFLEKRIPIWLEGEDLHISTPSNMDKGDMHVFLCKKYGYNALFAIRGYYWPGSHVQLYIGEYETPNCTILVTNYIFQYFPDIKYIGFGCHIGKPGEIWKPKVVIARNIDYLKDDIRSI